MDGTDKAEILDRSLGKQLGLTLPRNGFGTIQDRVTSYTVTVNFYYTSDFKKVWRQTRVIKAGSFF